MPVPGPTVAVASVVVGGTVVTRVGSLVSATVGLSEAPEEHVASELIAMAATATQRTIRRVRHDVSPDMTD